MKTKILLYVTMIAFVIAVCFGISKRNTYTDILSDPDYLNQVYVAEFPMALSDEAIDSFADTLAAEPYILEITPLDDLEYLYKCGRQYVEVSKVLKGDNIREGDRIYISSNRWQVVLDFSFPLLERGFVSFLEKDSTYLVFFCERIDSEKEPPVFLIPEEYIVTPVFAYEDREDIILPTNESSTYVPYPELKDNEYFVNSPEVEDCLRKLKKTVLERFRRFI